MLKQALEAITEFHRLGGVPIDAPLDTDADLRIALIAEELDELSAALGGLVYGPAGFRTLTPEEQRIAVADALGDIVYVALGAAVTWGIPLDRVFEAIHRSNMTKVEHGVTKRADEKIEKGPYYRAPDIAGALEVK